MFSTWQPVRVITLFERTFAPVQPLPQKKQFSALAELSASGMSKPEVLFHTKELAAACTWEPAAQVSPPPPRPCERTLPERTAEPFSKRYSAVPSPAYSPLLNTSEPLISAWPGFSRIPLSFP